MEPKTSKTESIGKHFLIQRPKVSHLNVAGHNRLLQKLFPKYINKLSLGYEVLENYKLISKLRLIKQVRTMNFQRSVPIKKGLVLQIIKPQKRYIKCLNGVDEKFYIHCPSLCKFEINIHRKFSWKILQAHQDFKSLSLKIIPNKDKYTSGPALLDVYNKLRWRLGVTLLRLVNLRHFRIEWNESTEFFALIVLLLLETLDIIPKFKKLRTFALYADYPNSEYRPKANPFMNIFKHVTEFSFGKLSILAPQVFVANLDNCTKLTKLELFLIEKEVKGIEPDFNVEYLGCLRNLPCLKSITIFLSFETVKAFETFLTSFSLPKYIEDITLSIEDMKWENLIPSNDYLSFKKRNPFEDLCSYLLFIEQWEDLDNLTCLKVFLEDMSKYSGLSEYFIGPILRRLRKLEIFDYKSHFEPNNSTKKIPTNLKYLWKALRPSKDTLKILNISDYAMSLKSFDTVITQMPNLQTLVMNSTVLGSSNLKNFLKCFERENQNSSPSVTAFITQFIIDNDESFKYFLEGLSCVPKQSVVSMFANVTKVKPEAIVKELSNFVEYSKHESSLSLHLSSAGRLKSKYWKELNKKIYESKRFQSLLILTATGKVVVDTRFVPDDDDDEEEEEEDTAEQILHLGFLNVFTKNSLGNILELPE